MMSGPFSVCYMQLPDETWRIEIRRDDLTTVQGDLDFKPEWIFKMLNDAYHFGEDIDLTVIGEPTSLPGAIQLAKHDKYQFRWWALGKVGAQPTKEDQKGADGSINGRLYFDDDGRKAKQILISVKDGKKAGLNDVEELAWTVQANKAKIGVLISITKPTKPMRVEATKAGFYRTLWGKFPKIQLLTVEDLLDGKRIEYPGQGAHNGTRQKALKMAATEPSG